MRETLDLVCQEEVQFGFWISALRSLIAPLPPGDPRRRLVPSHAITDRPLPVGAAPDDASLPAATLAATLDTTHEPAGADPPPSSSPPVPAGSVAGVTPPPADAQPKGQQFVWQPQRLQQQLQAQLEEAPPAVPTPAMASPLGLPPLPKDLVEEEVGQQQQPAAAASAVESAPAQLIDFG